MDEQSESGEQCYLYVQISGSKTGEIPIRQIVPSTCVKKFNYNVYKENNQIYHNKLLKIKLHPDGKKDKCFVLYAATDQHEVLKKSKEKRFAPRAVYSSETLSDESINRNVVEGESTELAQNLEDDIEVETEEEKNKKEMLQEAKVARKRKAEAVRKNKEDDEERILQNYLDDLDDDLYEDELNMLEPQTSTPLRNKNHTSKANQSDETIIHQQEIRIKQLENQLKKCRREIMNINKDYEERLNPNENRNTVNTSNMVCCSGIDPFKIHDKMFGFSKEQSQQELEYDEEGNVHLGSQDYFNPIAFNDAFKSKKPFNCLSLISEGVYGLEELSQRCVWKQTNTRNRKVLSPTKRLVIERKVYAFMRMKDQTIGQIDDFLDNLNAHHRKVINGAKIRMDYLKKQKEKEKEIDLELQQLVES